jgi:HSP20 family molecular chaperone IbpA
MSTPMQDQQVPVNMYEATDAVVIVAPLPGVMEDDVRVEVADGRLTIAAEMRSPAEKDYLLHEWTYGPWHRTVELPGGFGPTFETSFGNGQLAVRVLRS